MTNLFTCLSKKSLSNGNGLGMDREWIENGSVCSRKLFASILFLLFLGVGQAWGLESSEVANSAATTVSDGELFVIAATYSTTTYYLTTTVSSNWGRCTTDLDDATLFTAHGNTSSFYLTCSAGRLVAATSNFSAYDSGTTKNLTLSSSKITNSSSTSYFLDYNHSSGSGGARWYSSNQSAVFYLYKVTITPKTITYIAGSGTCKSEDTEASGGSGIVLPSATPSSLCAEDGWVFAGWKKTSAQTATTSIPDLIPGGKRYYPKTNETLYAVYRKGEYLEIDFESDISSYTDWTFNDIRLNAASPAITAHGGSQYGRNVNTSGNGVSTASITSNNKITSPGGCRFYVSKESTNSTSSTWTVETSSDGSSWTSRGSVSAASMDKGEWQVLNVDLSSYSNVYVRISYGSSNAIRAIDDIVLSSATFNSNPDCVYDYFIDIMHDTEIDPVQGTYAMPSPSDKDPGDEHCDEKHYHFLGWVEESEINDDGTLKSGYTLYPAGDSGHTANNKTYYAIWGKEE